LFDQTLIAKPRYQRVSVQGTHRVSGQKVAALVQGLWKNSGKEGLRRTYAGMCNPEPAQGKEFLPRGSFMDLKGSTVLPSAVYSTNLESRFSSTETNYQGDIMEWTAPVFEEVCLNCEINSYASATL
jgi:coenzyme PQQ precursor peptide PqqA